MRNQYLFFLVAIVVNVALVPRAEAGVITTRDGQRVEGAVRVESGRLMLRSDDGSERSFELSSIRHAVLREPQPSATKAPKEKPAEKLKLRKLEGVRAEYYDQQFTQLKLLRVDPRIDFEFPENEPIDAAVPLDFGVRWSGRIETEHSGRHTFAIHTHSDREKARLWIDGKLVIDRWESRGEYVGSIDLEGKRKYDLKMEYVDDGRWGRARLLWTSPRQGMHIVPTARLSPPAGTAAPQVGLNWPADGATVFTPDSVALEAGAADSDGQIRQVAFYVDGARVGVVEKAPWKLSWRPSSAGTYRVTARAIDNDGICADSPVARVSVAGMSAGTLPPAWAEMPVGKPPASGTARHVDGSFVIDDIGGDLWAERDACQLVFQSLSGDGTLMARLREFSPGLSSGAAAGLLLRENLLPSNARSAFIGLMNDGGLVFLRREQTWEERKSTDDRGSAPIWLKLVRHGRYVRAYSSDDAKAWRLIGSRRIEMGQDVFMGMAVASPGKEIGRAVFDNVSFTPGPPPMESMTKGVLLQSGTFLACSVHGFDGTSVKVGVRDRELTIPAHKLARIVWRPLSSEAMEQVKAGQMGLILHSGDFFEGAVESVRGNEVRINSVLFGPRTFSASDQSVAAILRPAKTIACRYELKLENGSRIRAADLRFEKGKLIAGEASEIEIPVSTGDLLEIKAAD